MFAILLHFKLATATMAGWMASQSGMMPVEALAMMMAVEGQAPIDVALFDSNFRVETRVLVERNGATDPDTQKKINFALRDWRGGEEKSISPVLMAMLADVSEHLGKPIEHTSGFRSGAWEGPHFAARALDFRIQGVDLRVVRDYIWAKYSEIGLGWYPGNQFLHLDSRPGIPDCAWTYLGGTEHYHPVWEVTARQGIKRERIRPGS